jgi:hypothetical protein
MADKKQVLTLRLKKDQTQTNMTIVTFCENLVV